MKIIIASRSKPKVDAVKEVIARYELFRGAEVVEMEVDSGVAKQPLTLKETVQGAINRAKAAFKDCEYSFGIESGLLDVPQTITGKLNFCVCVVYDGTNKGIGLSCAFEYPPEVKKFIDEGMDTNEAFFQAGLTKDRNLGAGKGVIDLLTKGRISRKEYTVDAIICALIQLENPELYFK